MRRVYKTRFGDMLVNEQDAFVGRSLAAYGEFSPGEASLFADLIRPGATVVDVGANIGAHTLQFSRLVGPGGRVHAFEPQRLIFQMLCANVALNQLNNVFCYPSAVGVRTEQVFLACPDPDTPSNFGGLSLRDLADSQGEPTSIAPLSVRCDFLKIDVEGMECEVLEGAEEAIRESRPIMYVENDRAHNSPRLLQTIERMGYTPFWHVTPLFTPDNYNRNPDNVFGANYVSFNLLCLPEGLQIQHDLDKAEENHEQYMEKIRQG